MGVANYGIAYEFSGLDQSNSPLKPTIKPYPIPTNQVNWNFSIENYHYNIVIIIWQAQQGEQIKSSFGLKNVGQKPLGTSFVPFKSSQPQYQPGLLRSNNQPFGPYPGYPGSVVYPGHGGYSNQGGISNIGGYFNPGGYSNPLPQNRVGYQNVFGGFGTYQVPNVYQNPSYRHEDFNHKQFGFQPYPQPIPIQPTFNPPKFGPAKKFNKNYAGLDFNQPGKYFQEHQFGAYHGHEFPSAIVPAEHNIKQSRPKDTGLGKPVIPTIPSFGFGSPPSFGYQVPQFPMNQVWSYIYNYT